MTPQQIKDALIQNANDALALAQQIDVGSGLTGSTGATGASGASAPTGGTSPAGATAPPPLNDFINAATFATSPTKSLSSAKGDSVGAFTPDAAGTFQTRINGIALILNRYVELVLQAGIVYGKDSTSAWAILDRFGAHPVKTGPKDPNP